jgi:hypothetical protein
MKTIPNQSLFNPAKTPPYENKINPEKKYDLCGYHLLTIHHFHYLCSLNRYAKTTRSLYDNHRLSSIGLFVMYYLENPDR